MQCVRFPWRACALRAPANGRRSGWCRAAARGFTLLELLVALTLMSMLVVMLFAGLRFGARVWDGGAAHSERIAEVRLAQEFLRRQLEQARPGALADDDPADDARFEGGRDRLRFLAPWPTRAAAAQLYLHELYLSDSGSGADLVVTLVPYRPGEERPAEPRITTLVRDVAEATFRYYGADDEDDPPAWHGDWQERSDLPALVQMRLELSAHLARGWPDLVVAPRHNAAF